MSRLIVKNLPKSVTQESLKKHFGSKGEITDVQLKYTSDGKFRQFAFIGYKSEEEANEAIEYFNNTHIKTNLIHVEACTALGDVNKPKAWSKNATDSTAFEKTKDQNKNNLEKDTIKKKKNKLKEIPEISKAEELLEKHNDDLMFKEFLDVQNKSNIKDVIRKTKKIDKSLSIDEESSESEKEAEIKVEKDAEIKDEKEAKIADKDISDLEYMKQLMNNSTETKRKKQEKQPKAKIQLFTVKLKGLPYTCKKRDVKQFLKPFIPYTIRLPRNAKGFAYAGFKTEKQFNQALTKDKSFLEGKQIAVLAYTGKAADQPDANASKNNKWISQEETLKNEEGIAESGRIFLRNLSYTCVEEDIEKLFSSYGPIAEVDLPVDSTTRKLKGFGTVTFLMPEHAVKAYSTLDGSVLHGRMLHLLPAKAKQSAQEALEAAANSDTSNFKLKKQKQQKAQAGHAHNWNTLFMGHNEVAQVIADDYGLSKSAVLDGDNVAVRLAMGETEIVAKAKAWLEEEGVCIDVFNQVPTKRSKTVILVKNLPARTGSNDIKQLFEPFGVLGRVLLPPSGVTAIVEFCEATEARKAFMKLAYSKYKNQPLYLEWAPEGSLKERTEVQKDAAAREAAVEDDQEVTDEVPEEDTTLFVKNLNFSTTDQILRKHFQACGKIYYARVATKKDTSDHSKQLSMGYGFVQFMSKAGCDAALRKLQTSVLESKTLELKRSERTIAQPLQTAKKTSKSSTSKPASTNSTKIMVKNVPFQAKQKEIMELFQAFGEIRALRLPKKMSATETDSHRGFAFIDYFTASDAKKAFEALSQSTHLYGRRLVLEWASVDDDQVDQIRKRTAQQFHANAGNAEKKSKKSTFDIDSL